MVTVKLFALLKDKAGMDVLLVDKSPVTVDELMSIVTERVPSLTNILVPGRIIVAVNQEFVRNDTIIRDGDEVGLMPPFSGGQTLHGAIRIQTGPFSLDEELARIKKSSPSIGGLVMFLGTTRDVSRGTTVFRLEFEHYPGMAEKKLEEIRERAIREFGIIDATIIHRVGILPVGENIVLIIVAAGHRDAAFRACRFCIDELKRITPIWKKETTKDGVIWVEEHP